MGKINLAKSLFIFSIFFLSCTNQDAHLEEFEIKQIKEEVLASFQIFENSLMNGDLDTLSQYYSDDSKFYWVENGGVAYPDGTAARAAITSFYPSLKSMVFKSVVKKVTPLKKSLAMLYVEYKQTLVFPSNNELKINGAMTILLEKQKNKWEFIIGHSSGKDQ